MNDVGIYCETFPGEYGIIEDSICLKNKSSLRSCKTLIGTSDCIYLQFTSINPSDYSEILKFINKYGFIGLAYHFGNNSASIMPGTKIEGGVVSGAFTTPISLGENIYDVQFHINLIQSIIWINEEIKQSDDYNTILDNYSNLYDFLNMMCIDLAFGRRNKSEDGFDDMIVAEDFLYDIVNCKCFEYFKGEIPLNELKQAVDIKELKKECLDAQEKVLNHFLSFVNPIVACDILCDHLECKWIANNLLSAMYFEIFIAMNNGKNIRKCANKTCSNYFEVYGNDTRKIYCSTKCAQSEAKRKQRRREKEQKGSALNGDDHETR